MLAATFQGSCTALMMATARLCLSALICAGSADKEHGRPEPISLQTSLWATALTRPRSWSGTTFGQTTRTDPALPCVILCASCSLTAPVTAFFVPPVLRSFAANQLVLFTFWVCAGAERSACCFSHIGCNWVCG